MYNALTVEITDIKSGSWGTSASLPAAPREPGPSFEMGEHDGNNMDDFLDQSPHFFLPLVLDTIEL